MNEKGKHIQIKISGNMFSWELFFLLYVVFGILLAIIYMNYLAILTVRGTELLYFMGIAGAMWICCYYFSRKYERNLISLIASPCLSIVFYESIRTTCFFPRIRIFLIIGFVISGIVSILFGIKGSKKYDLIHIKRKVFIHKGAFSFRVVCFLALIGICLLGRNWVSTDQNISHSDIDYNISQKGNDIVDFDNSLTANIEAISKLDPKRGWDHLTIEEKSEVLETVIRVECRYLGMTDSTPKLEIKPMWGGTLGQYDPDEDTISLSKYYVADEGGYTVLHDLCHEIYHRYQRYVVNLHNTLINDENLAKYADLSLFEKVDVYNKEMEDYYVPEYNSKVAYYKYSKQLMEEDAERYAYESVKQYYDAIQDYLK